MGELINFNNEEEQCLCISCQLAKEFTGIVKNVEDDEELCDVLRELIEIAGDNAVRMYLNSEIEAKMDLLEALETVEN